jgi:hypothetical protein
MDRTGVPQALGFDPGSGIFYAQNHESPLILFRPGGTKFKSYNLTSGQHAKVPATKQILVHPDGGRLLVLTDSVLFFIERQGKG